MQRTYSPIRTYSNRGFGKSEYSAKHRIGVNKSITAEQLKTAFDIVEKVIGKEQAITAIAGLS
ncbi:Uncharacterised protein [Sphingobacterium spiritivorum]|uniref:Uncharacterized protein n=1 Tax=Sphingobacterium spiritivorum TaxID=258 RepID=A0A380CU08_SPHSI|nr:hypothetical protein [Sphingobacterium spiritivorum]SUJ27294.1 Uncharacterised protein [Sphingobacterium spiritivorum]